MDNIITAVFTAGQMQTVAELPLYQWAYGQTLRIEGLELPEFYQVDFSNFEFCGVSIPQIGGADGVSVPVEVLATGAPVYAFVWLQDDTGGKTVFRVTINVIPRPVPFFDINPEEESAVAQAIVALNDNAEDAEAWAVGERNGVPVAPGDPTYENNAKYYAEHSGGGGGGTNDYNDLMHKPSINGVPLVGNLSGEDLQLVGEIKAASIAPEFSQTSSYAKGAMVVYDKQLYMFTADHPAGAWTGSDASAVKIADSSVLYRGQLTAADDMHALPAPGMYYVVLSNPPANFAYSGTGSARVLVNKSSTPTNHTAESHFVMGETGLWVERSLNQAGTSWTPWQKLTEQTPLKNEALALGLHTMPTSQGVINAIKRARQLTDIKWTSAGTIQRGFRETGDTYATSHGETYIGTFAADKEYTGLPYTENQYICYWHSLDNFATSIHNAASAELTFTPLQPVQSNKACYYGTNCVGLTGYALDIPVVASASYPSIRYLSNKGYLNHEGTRYPLESLKLCDLLQISGHVAIITDIITDASGAVTAVEICEATRQGNPVRDVTDGPDGGRCRRVTMEAEEFYTWFEDFIVRRFSNIDKVPYTPSKYSPMANEATPLAYWDMPCIPYEGNMHSYSILGTRVVKVLIASTFYTHLRVLKDGEFFSEYEIGNAASIDVQCANAEAVYTACLVRYADGAEAGRSISCAWAIRPLMTPTQRTIANDLLTITMSNFKPNGFKPWSIALGASESLTDTEKAKFYRIYDEDLTVTENQDGTVNYTFTIPYASGKTHALIRIMSDKFGSGSDTFLLT